MAELAGEVATPQDLDGADRDAMFAIMGRVYDGVARDRFEDDLAAKDEVILLREPDGTIGGFSTVGGAGFLEDEGA